MTKKLLLAALFIFIVFTFYMIYPKEKRNFTTGTVEAKEVEISTKYIGKVIKIYKDEGDFVKENEILLEIDKREILITKRETEKKLLSLHYERKAVEEEIKNLREELERLESLKREGAFPERDYERLKSRYQSLSYKLRSIDENIEALKENLEKIKIFEEETEIKSPISGVVIEKNIEVGELTKPYTPLFVIANLDTLYVYAFLPQKELKHIKLLKSVKIRPHIGEKIEFEGKVVWIKDEAEFTPRNILTPEEKELLFFRFKVKVINKDNILKPGMTVSVFYR
ncbi:MAG: efflux RND transporter periplasmic adaptor subunit [Candidatus Hydrothermales bacterium]